MRWFTKPVKTGPVRRTRLGLEQLGDRAVPSSSLGNGPDTATWTYTTDAAPPPAAPAPQIVNFAGQEVSKGWWMVTGQVNAGTSSGGQTVTFDGIPGLEGKTTVTLSDGSFSLLFPVATDGSDHGTATAQTTVNGVASNVAMCDIHPTT